MGNKLYVGNLAFSVSESGLEGFFVENGIKVEKVELARDVASGRSRGFGFVQLELGQDMAAAIELTNGKELSGRQLTVNEARERPRDSRGGRGRPDRGRGSHGGGRHGGGGSRY